MINFVHMEFAYSYNTIDNFAKKIIPLLKYKLVFLEGELGSGKTTLLNLMAGFDRQSSGSLLYEGKEYEKSWLGKVKKNESIFSSTDPQYFGSNRTVSDYVSVQFPKKNNMIENRYFKNSSFKHVTNKERSSY